MSCEGKKFLECCFVRPSNTHLSILLGEISCVVHGSFCIWLKVIRMVCNGVTSVNFSGENSSPNRQLDVHLESLKVDVGGDLSEKQSISPFSGIKEEKSEHWESIRKTTSLENHELVEVVDPIPSDDFRLHSEVQEAECSSSFRGTCDHSAGLEVEIPDVESVPRDGNDANVFKDVTAGHLRRKNRPLNVEWKAYRQGIEWRCRWLELRVKELQTKLVEYEEMLFATKHHKDQLIDLQEASMSRTAQINLVKIARVLHRRPRRKEEERADLKDYMSKHPLFSRYEKKKKLSCAGLLASEHPCDETSHVMLEESDDLNDDDELMNKLGIEEDTMEQLLWHIEVLQMHASKLNNKLNRYFLMPRSALKARSGDVTLQFTQGIAQGLLGPSNTTLAQRSSWTGTQPFINGSKVKAGYKINDLDMDSVIMPDHVMANYVEPARHAFIDTSHCHLLNDVASPDGASSSNEGTDAEICKSQHTHSLLTERHEMEPFLPKQDGFSEAHEGKLHERSDEVLVESILQIGTSSISIPRRRRLKRRERWNIAMYAKTFGSLLNVSCTQPLDGCKEHPNATVEDANLQV